MDYFDATHPSVVAEVNKGDRTFFKTAGDRIVIGRRVGTKRWLLEGVFNARPSQLRKSYASSSVIKFTEVYVTEIVATEGEIGFDAIPLKVDGEDWHLIVLLLPQLSLGVDAIQSCYEEDIKEIYLMHVIMHEINHVLTEQFITESGELNNFKSELLADTFLIQELNSHPNRKQHLAIKQGDVRNILAKRVWGADKEYYKLYLTLIDKLLSLPDQRSVALSAGKLQDILVGRWSGTTSDLYAILISELESDNR